MLLATGTLLAQQSSLIPVKIYISSHDDVYKFRALGVGIEELRDGYIEARVTNAKFDELQILGLEGGEIKPDVNRPKLLPHTIIMTG